MIIGPRVLPVVDPVRKVVVISDSRVSRCCPVVQLQREQRSGGRRSAAGAAASTDTLTLGVTLNRGTACRGCSPMQTKSTPIPAEGRPSENFDSARKRRNALAQFNASAFHGIALTVVNHALLGENHQKAVHFKDPHPRCDDHRHLTSAVKVTVDVVLVKHCGGHFP